MVGQIDIFGVVALALVFGPALLVIYDHDDSNKGRTFGFFVTIAVSLSLCAITPWVLLIIFPGAWYFALEPFIKRYVARKKSC